MFIETGAPLFGFCFSAAAGAAEKQKTIFLLARVSIGRQSLAGLRSSRGLLDQRPLWIIPIDVSALPAQGLVVTTKGSRTEVFGVIQFS